MRYLAALLFAFFAALPAQADARTYSQPELDRMLAPVALYPDSLLSQMLMAATYPDEVAEAAQWSRANPGLEGEEAVRAVDPWKDWDPSVKSLVAFPQVLQRMDENREWTRQLGEAFREQQPHVMDTVQQLRQRAQAAGNLRSNEQLVIQQQGQAILVQPARPEVVYVPYYDPLVVYGPWWHAAYPPVAWRPWPGYTRVHYPGITFSFWFGRPAHVAPRFFYGNFDWHRHHAHVVHHHHHYHPRAVGRWQHDEGRRRVAAPAAAAAAVAPIQSRQAPALIQSTPVSQAQLAQQQEFQRRQEIQRQNERVSQAQQMQQQELQRRQEIQRQNERVSQGQQAQQVQQAQQREFRRREDARRVEEQLRQRPVPVPAPSPMPQAVPRSTPAPAPQPQAQPRAQRQEQREHRQEQREHRHEQREHRQEARQEQRVQRQEHRTEHRAQPRHQEQRQQGGQRDNRRG